MKLTIEELLSLPQVEGRNLDEFMKYPIIGISTDSRSVGTGEIFVAIHGEKFDGNAFAAGAIARGALCAIVDREWTGSNNLPLIITADTVETLGAIARLYRRKFEIPVIAVAGSNGKTTTKEMIVQILSTQYGVLGTPGNLNNHIGVPQTLFKLSEQHQAAVVEIGTNHFGELEYLCRVLEPTHGVITNAGREHLEFFGDAQGAAKAEAELFDYLNTFGLAFVNLDDDLVEQHSGILKNKITYGFNAPTAEVKGAFVQVNEQGCYTFSIATSKQKPFVVSLPVPGEHIMHNALAAAAVGLTFGINPENIKRTLQEFIAVGKRMEVYEFSGVTIIDDTYNANPESMISALRTVHAMKSSGKKIAVLADMLELGKTSEDEHRSLGRAINSLSLDVLLTYGSDTAYIHGEAGVAMKKHYEDRNELARDLCRDVQPGDVVLVKGSRGMAMEQVVKALREDLERLVERESGTRIGVH
jgi:UDP-N-acetylmuramoyl-tripeptide--D-alanyl-D-alanine ligase